MNRGAVRFSKIVENQQALIDAAGCHSWTEREQNDQELRENENGWFHDHYSPFVFVRYQRSIAEISDGSLRDYRDRLLFAIERCN